MRGRDPKTTRYAPGRDPVPPEKQIPEHPTDSADWMWNEPQEYEDGPLFPDAAVDEEAK